MAQWGNKRQAVTVSPTTTVETTEGAPIGTYTLVKGGGGENANFGNTAGSRANTDLAMYKAAGPFPSMPGMKVGVIPVSASDIANPNSSVLTQTLSMSTPNNGSGYDAPNLLADVTFANGYTASGFLTSNNQGGSFFNWNQVTPSPRGTIISGAVTASNFRPAPKVNSVKAANGAGGFNSATDEIFIPGASSLFIADDRIKYTVPAGNTPIAPLVNGTTYYVKAIPTSNSITLTTFFGGAVINITDTRTDIANAEVHTFEGIPANAISATYTVSNTYNAGVGADSTPSPVAHAGWVVKREGTGGRAGRVHYETLVAMHSLANT